jgi:hypothetical protein
MATWYRVSEIGEHLLRGNVMLSEGNHLAALRMKI